MIYQLDLLPVKMLYKKMVKTHQSSKKVKIIAMWAYE